MFLFVNFADDTPNNIQSVEVDGITKDNLGISLNEDKYDDRKKN